MTYRIRGLDPQQFSTLFDLDDAGLAAARASRLEAGPDGRFPCRVSLRDARPGEELILVNFTSHEVETPYRSSFAILVRRDAVRAADHIDEVPPVLRSRPIALRGYSSDGNLASAVLALEDNVDIMVRSLLDEPAIAYIDAHNAAHGCFAARIERFGEES